MLDRVSHTISYTISNAPFRSIIILSTLLRLALLAYGRIHDHLFRVKYTDIDYVVFSDAARHVCAGSSPYDRETYRYTPLLAWMLVPNCYMPIYGKLLFSALDVLTGVLIYYSVVCRNGCDSPRKLSACVWLFNPISMVVSTRGSAESVVCLLVLLSLSALKSGHVRMGAIVYGVSVHFKVYPIIYALPLYLHCGLSGGKRGGIWKLLVNRKGLEFGVISGGVFLFLAAVFYYIYGYEFLAETYLYHLTRSDTQHNFSPYFYMLHLSRSSPILPLLSCLAFLPQLLLMLVLGGWLCCEMELAIFLQTAVFATYNKVVTSQYFLWYMSILPLIIPHSSLSFKQGVAMFSAWIFGQLLWLFPAYLYEFEGYPTYPLLWLAGLIFFFINVYNIVLIINNHRSVNTRL